MQDKTKCVKETKLNLSAAILVGLSTRMGRDKALLEVDGQSFIGRLAKELSVCREVFISSTLENDYSACGVPVVRDVHQGFGPIEGIRRSLMYAAYDHVFICAVDMPCVRAGMVRYLAGFISPEYDILVFRDEARVHPLCGIYSKAVLPAAEKMVEEGRHRMTDLIQGARTRCIDISGSGFHAASLVNINTPEEYRAIAGGGAR